jgi:hypothetical protein
MVKEWEAILLNRHLSFYEIPHEYIDIIYIYIYVCVCVVYYDVQHTHTYASYNKNKISASSWFYYKKFNTLHGHINVKHVFLCQYEICKLEFILKSPKILYIKEIEIKFTLNGGSKSNTFNADFINFSKVFSATLSYVVMTFGTYVLWVLCVCQ